LYFEPRVSTKAAQTGNLVRHRSIRLELPYIIQERAES
jgi:hypothetical protein